jgi:hypothetical protein
MGPAIAVLAVLTLTAQASDAEPPIAVVDRFIAFVDASDASGAAAMLTNDAMLGIGDVGGPLRKETVLALNFKKQGCRRSGIHETDGPPKSQPDVRFVELRYICPYGAKSGRSGEHEITVTYFAQGSKIAGYYLHAGTAPKP